MAARTLGCNNDMNHSFLLIDDHALFRAGLRMTLESAHPGVPLREAATLDEAVHTQRDAPAPTVVLLDLQLPGLNGMDGMALIQHKWPECAIVVLSADDSPDTARRPGRGSVFRLAVPLAAMPALSGSPLAAPALDAPARRALPLRVLVIDDDAIVRISMQELLAGWGCDCQVADGIEPALTLAASWPPELIISDYRLREQRTGAEAIAMLRAQAGSAIPALLITGDTAPARLREARASGVPLLHKPTSPEQLYRAMEQACAGRSQQGQSQQSDTASSDALNFG